MKIAIMDTGHVGRVSSVCLSDFGHNVICLDKDLDKISILSCGEMSISEPGFDQLLTAQPARAPKFKVYPLSGCATVTVLGDISEWCLHAYDIGFEGYTGVGR